MQKKLKRILTLCLCALLAVIPLSGVKESFAVQNIEKSAMVKSIGLDREDGAQLSFVTSVINDSSAFHEQSLISAAGDNFSQAEQQAQIFRTLDVTRRIGVTLTDSGLMIPQKSVTAVVGVSPVPVTKRARGCAQCNLFENCQYRKDGTRCDA